MIIHSPIVSIFANLLGAGRRLGERTRRQSRQLSGELRQSCNSAVRSLQSLRQFDRRQLIREIPRAIGHLLRETYVNRPAALLRSGIAKRTAWFMVAGSLPLLIALSVILLPTLIFDSPQCRAYYFFARTLIGDPFSLLPVLLGFVAVTTILHFPPAEPRTGELD